MQILPQVPPAVCGVGDYAWNLACQLRSDHGIYSTFLTTDTSWKPAADTMDFPVSRLFSLKEKSLLNYVNSYKDEFSVVILHMSAYGYQKRGVPYWLAAGWRAISRMHDRPRLLTMYHELAASGPVTSSAFWLNTLQKWMLRKIALASDGLRTNRVHFTEWLGMIPGIDQKKIVTMPVPSNFGEPDELPFWHQRDPAMVMFGWGISSGESLPEIVNKVAGYCRRFGLKKLHLIGGNVALNMTLPGVELLRYGYMSGEEISNLLISCRMAYTAYDPEYFGKSGLMAAFASHGLVVICQGKTNRLSDGLEHGVHVLNESTLGNNFDESAVPVEALAAALREWYDEHSLVKNAASYASQIHALLQVP